MITYYNWGDWVSVMSCMIDSLVRKKSIRENEWCSGEKYENSFAVGLFSCHLSSSPNSSVYYFIVSVDFHFLFAVPVRFVAGLRTVLKSPPMIILESVKLHNDVKNLWKTGGGHLCWVCRYLLWSDWCYWLMYLRYAIWVNGILLWIKWLNWF